jgi:formate hydrogenlyase subunit 3/multisubunit Na+/H+ antiporter MnhD subunit
MTATPLSFVIAAIVAWLVMGGLGLARPHDVRLIGRVLFPVGALIGVALAGAAGYAIALPPAAIVLPLGLPDLPFHLRLDALSAFFLMLLGGAGAAVSLFSAGYFRSSEGTPPGLICFQYHAFLAAMALVLVA